MGAHPPSGRQQMMPCIVPVLAGGGARLPAHIGILEGLHTLGVTYEHLVGVSGGSIVGALRAAGMPLREIRQLSRSTDFSRFAGQNLLSLLRTGGLSNGNHFESWMDQLLDGRTFSQMPLGLHILATDVRSGRPVIFSRETSPDMRVSQAVRCSMSVPILFSFIPMDDRLLVDGSILSEEALQRDWTGDRQPVVVFKLRSSSGRHPKPRRSPLPLLNYLEMLVHTFMTALSREYINDQFWLSTIVVETGNISPFDLRLADAEKDRLYHAGRDTTLEILPRKLAQRLAPTIP